MTKQAWPTLDDFVGNTPLVRIQRLATAAEARGNVVLAKLEGNNPAGSVKDRSATSMVVDAQRRGAIKPGDRLIEATSGNTGIALAMAAAMKGFKITLIMPENASREQPHLADGVMRGGKDGTEDHDGRNYCKRVTRHANLPPVRLLHQRGERREVRSLDTLRAKAATRA